MMRRALLACALGSLLLGGPAAAVPGVDEPSTVHVNAVRNPELRKYKAIMAGLDTFTEYHRLAPAVRELKFHVRQATGRTVPPPTAPLRVRLEGDGNFILPLALDPDNLFTVPRSEEALDANSELVLNQKKRYYRIAPYVRTPGLPANVRRLGDLRLECRVMMAIGKEEIPLFWVVTINGILMTRDWCGFFNKAEYSMSFATEAPVVSAILVEGNRSAALKTGDRSFSISLYEPSWSDDALVELTFGEPAAKTGSVEAATAAPATATGTADETPRTAP
jgi:hypothetical protein